ncbi:dnaJ homolog subfamily B member 13-like [Bradysia coprophila]|uniref:dnaJ homolog subfamily B member 13-like n=1 Tax=Bradysia coprophila TaxID=38358 RepID=UPI00187DA918|nr:dnaJ homolog subfamily B member 13-like [Bradysia coprophila]
MVKDYYAILNIPENSSPQEILEAYKVYATKSHPQNPSEDVGHLPELSKSKIWQLVNEAYDVLSNPETKDIFDRYGEDGLLSGTTYHEPYVYRGDPMKTYNDTFAFESPKTKDANLEITLPLDITEVYHGTVKVVQILRRNYDAIRKKSVLQEHRLIIPIQPGVTTGTKYLFREEGDQGPDAIPADVIFKVKDMENGTYRRDGSDLHMNCPIELIDALCGFRQPVPIRTLDDRTFNIMLTGVVGPSYVKQIPNEGLPMEDNCEKRGDLYIHFNIKFPAEIPVPVKKELRKLLEQLPQ